MVTAEDVIHIYRRLAAGGVQIWLCGGWGIDALLGAQTRPHKDLDMLVLLDDARRLREILGADGYTLKELWSENRWLRDAAGVETATAFVLRDEAGRELDIHALHLDEVGNGLPAFHYEGPFYVPQSDFSGEGFILGQAVRCIPYRLQELAHQGYELPELHVRDMEKLRRKFAGRLPS